MGVSPPVMFIKMPAVNEAQNIDLGEQSGQFSPQNFFVKQGSNSRMMLENDFDLFNDFLNNQDNSHEAEKTPIFFESPQDRNNLFNRLPAHQDLQDLPFDDMMVPIQSATFINKFE